jgi:exodeoxyribonuclease VII small subunit
MTSPKKTGSTKSNASAGTQAEPKGYAEALRELEKILGEIDGPAVDVDVLASKVERASYLVTWCNERITAAQFAIDEVVASLPDVDLGDDDEDDEYDEDEEDEDDDE